MPSALPVCTRNRVNHAQAKSGWRRGLIHIEENSERSRSGERCSRGRWSSWVSSANGSDSSSTASAIAAYPAALPVTTAVTSTAPSTRPSACGMPTQPDTPPRCATGTRSGIAAVRLASIVLKQTCAATQATATPAIVFCRASSTRASAPITAPNAVQTCRRPKWRLASRSEVRSDNAPASGFASTAASAPMPVTTASIASLSAGAIRSTCCGNSTWIGVKNAIQTPRLAAKISAIQLRRTGTVGSASAAGSEAGVGFTVVTAGPGPGTRRTTTSASAAACRSRRAPGRTAW